MSAVQNTIVDPEVAAHINPQLQKKLDLVIEYLIQGKYVDVPFTSYPANKKLSKLLQHSLQG